MTSPAATSPCFVVYANGRAISRHGGLIAACAIARDTAGRQHHVAFRVERYTSDTTPSILEATYKHDGQRLAAWMR